MTKLALAFAAALALLSACKSKGKQAGAPDAVANMTAIVNRLCACADAACASKVNDELVALTKQQSPSFTEAEVKTMAALGTKANDCLTRLTSAKPDAGSGSAVAAPPSGSGSGQPAGSDAPATSLPKECDDYKAVVDRIQSCEKLSRQARETLLKAFGDAAEGWHKATGDEKTRIGVSCKAAADSLTATAKAQCGW